QSTLHIEWMRLATGRSSAGAWSNRRTRMKERANPSAWRKPRWALLPAVALIGVIAGLTNAFAFDQPATDDAIDNAASWGAVSGGGYSGPYARGDGTVYLPRHRHYR